MSQSWMDDCVIKRRAPFFADGLLNNVKRTIAVFHGHGVREIDRFATTLEREILPEHLET